MSDEIKKVYYNTKPDGTTDHLRWWESEDGKVYERLIPLVKQIEARQLWRKVSMIRNAKLYENMDVLGLYASTIYASQTQGMSSSRIKLNVVSSVVDTAASKIAKSSVRPYFLTNDSDWDLQDQAKQLTKFMDGQMDAMGFYADMKRAFVDCEVVPVGAVKFYKENGTVNCERTAPEEILVDDADGIYGKPSQLHQIKYVNRYTLAAKFKNDDKKVAAIYAAPSAFESSVNAVGAIDVIRVIESWKLPNTAATKDGKHVIAIDGCDLYVKQYKKSYFPFVFLRWKPRMAGFYGLPLVDEIAGIQLLIDRVIRMIEKGITTVAVPRVWIESTSAVNKNTITNLVGSVGEYTGTPPVFQAGQAFNMEVYEFLNMLIRWSYEFTGISQLSAQSKKPDGLDSGAALREYNDIESERFQLVSQMYEKAHLEGAKIIIDMMRDIKASGTDPVVKAKDGKFIDEIAWSEVDMDEDRYDMRVFPSSLLPTQPAGRMQKAIELVQAGFIDKDMAMSLLDFPDVESAMSLKTSAFDDARMVIGHILKTKEYIPPEPYMDLALTKQTAQSSYLRAKTRNAPEDSLELLRRFIDDTQTLIEKASMQAQQQQMEAQMPPQGAAQPMAVPEAQPVSDIMPVGA